jgi:saposin
MLLSLITFVFSLPVSLKNPSRPKISTINPSSCTFCQQMLDYASQLRLEHLDEASVSSEISSFCTSLPLSLRSACNRFIFPPAGSDFLSTCISLNLCDSHSSSLPRRLRGHRPVAKHLPQDFLCDICQDFISAIEDYVLKQFIEADIEQFVAVMCDALPYPGNTFCTAYIDQYVEEIISEIQAGIDGFNICGKLGLCDANSVKKSGLAIKPPTVKRSRKSIPGESSAEMFNSAVHYIEELRKFEYPKAEIEAAVVELCEAFRFPLLTACRSLVVSNLNAIIESLDSGLASDAVVKKFGMNVHEHRKRNQVVVHGMPKGVVCDICQAIVDFVIELILEDVVEADIEALVNQMCLEFPFPLGGICQAFADEFIDEIIKDVEAGMESFDICTKIGLCTSQDSRTVIARRTVSLKNFVRRSLLKAKPAGVMCDICQDIIHAIEQLVLEGIAEEVIIDIADDICDLLPMPGRSFCISVVDREIETIIDWIVQGIDALDICGKLGFCSLPPSS